MNRKNRGDLSKVTYRKIGLLFLIGCLLAICAPFSHAKTDQTKKVLVLHSYHKGLRWTDHITKGIESALLNSDQEIELYLEYMDTKRIHDAQHFQNLYELYRHKFRNRRFDLIVSSDDHAFNFLLAHHQELFPDTPIVFCGVNDFKDSMLVGHNLITGVVESFDIKGTIDVALQLHPNAKEVFVIVDKTLSGTIVKALMIKDIPYFKDVLRFTFLEDIDMSEVLERVENLSRDSIVFLISLLTDRSGNTFSFKKSCALISEYSAVPIYSHSDAYFGHGIVGGMLNCGDAQGKMAGEMALRILQGDKVKDIPVVKKSPNRYKFDYQQMQRFGTKLSSLPEGSTIINRPYSFYSEHKGLVWSVVACIAGLALIVLILSATIISRRRAGEALRENEEKYRTLVEQANDGVVMLQDGKIKFANSNMAEMLGYTVEELLDNSFNGYIAPDELPRVADIYERRMKNEAILSIYESAILHKDGSCLEVEFNAGVTTYKGEPAVLIIVRDITERKKMEEAIKESEERYHGLSDAAFEAIFISEKGVCLEQNSTAKKMFGYTLSEAIGRKGTEWIAPEDREMVMNNMLSGYEELYEATALRKDGSTFPAEIQGKMMHYKGRNVRVTALSDITERKQAEDALHESEEKLAGIISSVTDHISMMDEGYNIVWANDVAKKLFGPDLVGKKCYATYHGYDKPCEPCIARKCFEDGKAHEHETEVIRADGNKMTFWCTASVAARDKDGRPKMVVEVSRDITKKKALQAEVMRVTHLASLGELAAGVAHEINNPINGVINYAQMLIDQSDGQDKTAGIAGRIIKEGDRIAEIVKNLLTFAHDWKEEHGPALIQDILAGSLGLIKRHILKDGIRLEVDISPDLPGIRARKQQIQQVFMNILSNARHALNQRFAGFHEDKFLKISCEVVEIEGHKHIRTTFYDTGTGIPADILDSICDPFFSTKSRGEGTGLGLSISYGIVKEHGGKLLFDSKEGEYTKVMVDLPVDTGEKMES